MSVATSHPAGRPASDSPAGGGTHGRLGPLGWAALAIGAAMLLPILAVIANVFGGAGDTWRHLAETVLAAYVSESILLALGVAVGVIGIGVTAAWLVVHYRFPGRRWIEWALVLPLAMPAYVIAYAYTDWLQFTGPVQTLLRDTMGWAPRSYWFPDIRSLGGAIAVFSLVFYPYVYLLVRTAFLEQSASTLEAARLAGLGPLASLARVGVPLARPAIAAGTALALMETLADFGAVSYFGVQTFTTGIFRAWQSFGDRAAAAQLAVMLLAFVAAILLAERWTRGRARYQASAGVRPVRPAPLAGMQAAAACAVCLAPVVFGFVLPACLLALLAIDARAALGVREFALVFNSATLAIIAACVTAVTALVLAYAARRSRAPPVRIANRAASLGYAIPGAVIAVGVLVPLGRIDNLIAGWAQEQFGARIGLVLTGTIVALVYAYVVRFVAIALQSIEAGLARITPSMDDAARSLGYGPRATLIKVHVPLLRGSLATALLLVFVDVMKELPATFALRPFNFDTLSVHIYNLAKDERLGEAALPSLLLVAVGLIPLALLARQMRRGGGQR